MSQNNAVAVWSGASAFFGNMVGLKLLEKLSDEEWAQIGAAIFVSLLVAGAVYSRERLVAAQRLRNGNGRKP